MEWYDDSKACLGNAKILLSDIKMKQRLSITDDKIVASMKVDIKNFLENCRSPLDYAAQYIFEEYCKEEYLKKKSLKKKKVFIPKIYYPIRGEKESFMKEIDKIYFPLKQNKSEIINIFQKGQLFTSPRNPSLHYLNLLTNQNKHRNLTKHERQISTHIRSYTDENGNNFKNVYSSNNYGIVINGLSLGEIARQAMAEKREIDATIKVEYYFKDINKSVIPTLESIYKLVDMIVKEIKEA